MRTMRLLSIRSDWFLRLARWMGERIGNQSRGVASAIVSFGISPPYGKYANPGACLVNAHDGPSLERVAVDR